MFTTLLMVSLLASTASFAAHKKGHKARGKARTTKTVKKARASKSVKKS